MLPHEVHHIFRLFLCYSSLGCDVLDTKAFLQISDDAASLLVIETGASHTAPTPNHSMMP